VLGESRASATVGEHAGVSPDLRPLVWSAIDANTDTRSQRPALVAVDGNPEALARIERTLSSRYGRDYEIVCVPSPAGALETLERKRDAGEQVAIVLADQWSAECQLLARAGELHPLAKRGLLIEWGGWGNRETAEAIFGCMARREMDYYVMKPVREPDEQFHRTLAEFLQEWSKATSSAGSEVLVVGDRWTQAAHRMRDLLARNGVPYRFCSSHSEEGRALLAQHGIDQPRGPVAITRNGTVLESPTRLEVAEAIGVPTRLERDDEAGRSFDVVVVGGGPGGLTAAVYASSEGLRTLVIESESIGGQAGSSSLIRNYLGFQRGVHGAELAQRAYQQAWVFRTEFLLMREATDLRREGDRLVLDVKDIGEVNARAVVLATGVSYRRLEVPELERLIGAGVYYGASISETQGILGKDVHVVGGGNSAGQAVMHLARFARRVTLVARRSTLDETMSSYLRNELDVAQNVEVRCGTEVIGGGGQRRLEYLTLRNRATSKVERVEAAGLFLLIGGHPRTEWLPKDIERDRWGYLLTGLDLVRDGRVVDCWPLRDVRNPRMLETSMPGVFAIGDVRHGSIQRCAAAVGDGSLVVYQIQRMLSSPDPHEAPRPARV
jgi:thioredoxin reductase (NADPH)